MDPHWPLTLITSATRSVPGAAPPRGKDRGLTANHLETFLDPTIWKTFEGDGENSFFTIYRNLFSRLAYDESQWSSSLPEDFPSFGDHRSPWAKADGGSEVRVFYAGWLGFSTSKDFSWVDKWDLSDAPDRRVRRLMEKENRRARDDARKEYNDVVKSLAMFVRKRDPRYKAHLKAQSRPPITSPLTEPPTRQANAEPGAVYIEQEWQKANIPGAEDLEWALAEGNDDSEFFECVVCGKSFKSEAAWNSHERSKKHIKNVEVLRRQMEEEGVELGLPTDQNHELGPKPAGESKQSCGSATPPTDNAPDAEHEIPHRTKEPQGSGSQTISIEETSFEDAEGTGPGLIQEQKLSKRDKRKLREAKKQAQAVEDAHRCYLCEAKFESRSSLFNHIRNSGHGIANPAVAAGTKTKGTRGKR